MNSLRSVVILVAMLSACSKKEGDVPLRVANPPTCASGLGSQVVVRIEGDGNDHVQPGLDDKMHAPNTWAGKKVKVKAALCPLNNSCTRVSFAHTIETTIGGSDRQLSIEIPKIEVICADGTAATQL